MNKKVRIIAGIFIAFFMVFSISSTAVAGNSINGILGSAVNQFQNSINSINNAPNNVHNNAPEIFSVSTVYPTNNQRIVIKGTGFGSHFSYNGDSRFIKITDITRNWNAGDSGNMVHLYISSWTNNEIVINGFTGSYGNGSWSLMPGDQITIKIWNSRSYNSQNRYGSPGMYNLTVE
ncbi:MAG: hypothetical protein EVJ46_03265 [Candidatus Acididesulfobacter guangdongensis]|uniref:IPT/TIG domain-containing protein n=1 Tax=Acididesulfobacter guangdongensis TaxID=2597225 RepID=A0A519BJ22_ACIG2|nr:MAG: hypothetical protein EVJ46_03265 [Candidatus Acididesulfobacter guangdongensis]